MKAIITKTKTVVNLPADQMFLVLMESGILSPYVAPPAVPPKPDAIWTVGVSRGNEYVVSVYCRSCRSSEAFIERISEKCIFHHCGVNERVPKDILKQYDQLAG